MDRPALEQEFQIQDNIILAGNGIGLKKMMQAGQQWLQAHVNVVNGLNVFPVPDGDTGTNMLLTVRSALKEAEASPGDQVGVMAAALAHGALLGARGNSGVILSQFLEGLAVGLAGQATFTVEELARAIQVGADKAYRSVVNPVEGTILTVARRVAEAAQQNVQSNRDVAALFRQMVEAAKVAEAETPELLPVLKEAGVTDSGGQGLVYILEGMYRWLSGEPVDADPAGEIIPVLHSTLGAEQEAYGYDVQFLIEGDNLDVDQIRARIDSMGWSTVVVGGEQCVKVHVHTPDPGIPISYGASLGRLNDVVVENMEVQARRFVAEHTLPASEPGQVGDTAIICVAPGPGLADIFRSLGASEVLLGGQTMNPSIQELLAAIQRVETENVLILPNNGNVILAAQQAQALAGKRARVVPTKTTPQGIAALLSFNYQADLETNARRMAEAAQKVDTIEITRSVRDTAFNGFYINTGDVIGLLNDNLVSVGQDYDEVTLNVLSRLGNGAGHLSQAGVAGPDGSAREYELVTIYFGKDCPDRQARSLARKISEVCPGVEVEVHPGGQPHYHYILSLE